MPPEWAGLFEDDEDLLASHRGWDPGSRVVAAAVAERLSVPLLVHPVTRLLVDLNRSEKHPHLFSERSRGLPPGEKERILERWYRPHRSRVEARLGEIRSDHGRSVHVGIHTFTPVLRGRPRTTAIGLLYDPAREPERRLVRAWQDHLRRALPELRVHRNRPYRGTADGLTTFLRRRFSAATYQGIEVEVRSDLVVGPEAEAERIGGILADGLARALEAPEGGGDG